MVDGFSRNEKEVYEFNGCYFHHHECALTRHITDQKWLKERKKIRKREQERIEYISRHGYEIEIFWECEYENLRKTSPDFKTFIENKQMQRPLEHRSTLTTSEIISAVREEKIFGAVEVDIQVPDHLYETFSEMSPIFCNSRISFESLGAYTQETGKRLNVSQTPRRLLVGGMRARKILLATPLLKWYLDHGLTVSGFIKLLNFLRIRVLRSLRKM